MDALQEVAEWLEPSQKIAVITGAGMSTESGIPDFRSAKGLYNEQTNKGVPMEEVLSRSFFDEYPREFYRIYKEKLLYPQALPNKGHHFLKHLEDIGYDVTIITQNIDGLHQKAGSRNVLELHGNANNVITQSGAMGRFDETSLNKEGLSFDGEWARPAITLYGEALDTDVLNKSIQALKTADILFVMGTSLNVYPAAGLIYDYTGSKSALITKGATPLNTYFDFVFDETISGWVDALSARLSG
ncbi:NAD-dependent protein deacylase [Alkalibacterium sp. f15]|uniref:NAD-dependent protein deacylase n=1 Tax=Alkalibacterium sp. f15 TaxID=3414029 RepID=UPI003BF7AE2A